MSYDDAPACERAVPTHPEVVTVDMSRGHKASPDLGTLVDPVLPPRRLPLAQVADVQHHRLRDTPDTEVAGDKGLIRTPDADCGAREPDLRKVLYIEEVRAAEVNISVWFPAPETPRVDHSLDA